MDTPIWEHLLCRPVVMFIAMGIINYDIDLGIKRGYFPRTIHTEVNASMKFKHVIQNDVKK